MLTVYFHGGPADGETFELQHHPAERVVVESIETARGSAEVIWCIYLYRRNDHKDGNIHYWLGDIQVATNGIEKWGKNYAQMLH